MLLVQRQNYLLLHACFNECRPITSIPVISTWSRSPLSPVDVSLVYVSGTMEYDDVLCRKVAISPVISGLSTTRKAVCQLAGRDTNNETKALM